MIADVVPERFVAEGLVEALADVPVRRALVARAAEARDVLPDALRARGAEVDVVALYETVAEPLDEAALEALERVDYVTFTSSSTVTFFFDVAGDRLGEDARLVSIGPVTSAALRARGREPDVEAEQHDIDGLVAALVADVAGGRPGRLARSCSALWVWRGRLPLEQRSATGATRSFPPPFPAPFAGRPPVARHRHRPAATLAPPRVLRRRVPRSKASKEL